MAGYDSPLGSKKVSGNRLREFDVPDETENQPVIRTRSYQSSQNSQYDMEALNEFQSRAQGSIEGDPNEVEREIRAMRELKKGKDRLNDGAKRRIEMLLGMTRTTRKVDFGDNKSFGLHTLKAKEMREAMLIASSFDGTVEGPYEIRKQLLARSIYEVSGIEVAQFVGSDSLDAKLAFVDELDETLLNQLYGEYFKLVADSKNKFSINNDEDAKGLIEDLKKS
jgi:hypothetical protein